MAQHRTHTMPCPECDEPLNGHSNMQKDDDRPPRDGALTMCAYCYAPLAWAGTQFRRATEAEAEEIRDAVMAWANR